MRYECLECGKEFEDEENKKDIICPICKNDMIPLLQHGMTRIVMAIRLRIEKRKIARLLKEGWLS